MSVTSAFIPLGLAVIMATVGLGLSPSDFRALVQRPSAVAAGLAGQLVLVPAAAFVVASAFGLPPVAAIGLVLVACVPGGVTSNFVTVLARGDAALSVVLTAGSTVAGIVAVPLVLSLAIGVFDAGGVVLPDRLPVADTARAVLVVTALPLLVGMGVRALRPAAAHRLLRPARRLATGLFALIVAAALVGDWAVVTAHARALGPAVVAFNLTAVGGGLALARWLKLPSPAARTLAVECGLQNVALALFLGGAVLGTSALMVPAVLYVLVMNATALGLVLWSRRQPDAAAVRKLAPTTSR